MIKNENIKFGVNFLKFTAKQFILKNAKSGDILKVKSDFLPIIYHYGIIKKEDGELFILHNDPDTFNKSGGSIIQENLKDWIKDKDIVEVFETDISNEKIDEISQELKHQPYDLVHFNCEHFISKFVNKRFTISPQIKNWAIFTLSVVSVYFILKSKNNG